MPTKKVVLDLEIDADVESVLYAAISDLLVEIEESEFTLKNVKVEDSYSINLTTLQTPRLSEIRTRNRGVKRPHRYTPGDEYDG